LCFTLADESTDSHKFYEIDTPAILARAPAAIAAFRSPSLRTLANIRGHLADRRMMLAKLSAAQ
jgi:hypothetical protein